MIQVDPSTLAKPELSAYLTLCERFGKPAFWDGGVYTVSIETRYQMGPVYNLTPVSADVYTAPANLSEYQSAALVAALAGRPGVELLTVGTGEYVTALAGTESRDGYGPLTVLLVQGAGIMEES